MDIVASHRVARHQLSALGRGTPRNHLRRRMSASTETAGRDGLDTEGR